MTAEDRNRSETGRIINVGGTYGDKVRVFIGDREITEIVRVEVASRAANRPAPSQGRVYPRRPDTSLAGRARAIRVRFRNLIRGRLA